MQKQRFHNWHTPKLADNIDWNRVSHYQLSRILRDMWVELTPEDWRRLVAYHPDLIDEMPKNICQQ